MTPEALDAFVLSVRVAVVATLLNATLGIPLAYLLARRRFRANLHLHPRRLQHLHLDRQ